MIPVKFKKLNPNAILPTRGSEYAAGYDLYACIDEPIEIYPHGTIKVGTGLATQFPEAFWIGIFARSGLATKQGLRPANCVGVIDPDYRGQIIIALHNDTDEIQTIQPNDRIGQMIIIHRHEINIQETEELSSTSRGEDGFGSTGI